MSKKRTVVLGPDCEMEIPEHYALILDGVMETDREYFEQHPDAWSYDRDYVPGELWPMAVPICSVVRVYRIGPGLRARWVPDWQETIKGCELKVVQLGRD